MPTVHSSLNHFSSAIRTTTLQITSVCFFTFKQSTVSDTLFVNLNFPVRSFSSAHVNCEVGGGNNIFAEDAPPQPLSEVQYPCQYPKVNTSRIDVGFCIVNALDPMPI
nr:MAG: hypothetical protein [Cressdnaviricota sp.]